MEPIWNWGNNVIVSIQSIHSPTLDAFFNGVTFLGEAEFLLLFLPLIVWSVNKSTGVRLVYLVFISAALNTWAKLLFHQPRPFEWPSPETSPVLKLNARAEGPGMPSGHAQNSLVMWFYLASQFHRRWFWGLAAVLFGLISFSRVYLGVHFPTDILGGAVLGAAILWLYIQYEPALTASLSNLPRSWQAGLAIGLPAGIIFLHPHPTTVAVFSVLGGFTLGVILDHTGRGFKVRGTLSRRIMRYMLGLILLLVIFVESKFFLPSPASPLYLPLSGLRLAIAGFWISGGAPWLFLQIEKIQTARTEQTHKTPPC